MKLEEQLNDSSHRPSSFFFIHEVDKFCGSSSDCSLETYHFLIRKLERRFDLSSAIQLSNVLAEVARKEGKVELEANAYRDLYRFHDALGNKRTAIESVDKAIALYQEAGLQAQLSVAQMTRLEAGLRKDNIDQVFPQMEEILSQAYIRRDTQIFPALLSRLIFISMDAQWFEKADTYVGLMESIPISNPPLPHEYGAAILAALGRADLKKQKGRLLEAKTYYQEALRLCQEEPSKWLEIHSLHSLAEVNWKLGDRQQAWDDVNLAQVKGEELNLDDLLSRTFELKAQFAEEEGKFSEALASLKQMHLYKEKFAKRGEDFNPQAYVLELEKDQLASEKNIQALKLQVRNVQLRTFYIISLLSVAIVIILVLAVLSKDRQRKNLAAQHTLITQQTRQLRQLDEVKNRFFANVSHELRTPISLILGPISSLLRQNKLEREDNKRLSTVQNSARQLKKLVDEILDLGKLDLGKMELNIESTSLKSFFHSFAAQFESLAAQKNISFLIRGNLFENQFAAIDKEKFRRILSNLLSNAIKFTPEEGEVSIEFLLNGKDLKVEVSDSGLGIHPEDLPHVFERYFQSNIPEKQVAGGTGIGLALSQEYARLMGGEILVDSKWGQGARFILTIPLREVVVHEPEVEQEVAEWEDTELDNLSLISQSSSNKHSVLKPEASYRLITAQAKILLVEDNLSLQSYLTGILSKDYELIVANSGQMALNHLSTSSEVDLIISDLMMPVMDGFELIETIKSKAPTRHIPSLLLTARADQEARLTALRIGIDDYLTKPFEEVELILRIKNLLKNQAFRRQNRMIEKGSGQPIEEAPSEDESWLLEVEKYVKTHLSDPLLTIPQLALQFALSESSLLRKMKRLTGLSPQQYLQEVRLAEARRLLEQGSVRSVAKLAEQIGYKDSRSFSRRFKEQFGRVPSDYLKK